MNTRRPLSPLRWRCLRALLSAAAVETGWTADSGSCALALISRRGAPLRLVWCALAATGLLLAGCTRHEPTGPAGVLRLGHRNEPATLDPQLATLPDEYFPARALFEGLVTPSPDGGAPLPGVAERWAASPDGLTWTFHLRADARWSNGDPVKAGDFVYAFRRILTPALGAAKSSLFFPVRNAQAYRQGRVTDFAAVGFAAPDDRTLVVTLEHAAPYLPALAATGAWLPLHPPTLERAGTGRDSRWTEPGRIVGNGPYVLREWTHAQLLEFTANPHYWNRAAVRIPTLRLVFFDNNDAEERAFRAGQLDVTMTVPAARLAHYAANEPALLRRQPLYETRFLALNPARGPLADVRVRRALSLAVDRSALVAHVLKGGQEPARTLVPPGLGGYQFDPAAGAIGSADAPAAEAAAKEESRRLLAEAGFPGGRGFPRLEFSTWTNTPVLEAIQQMWQRELGIDTAITLREGRVHLAAMAAGDFDLSLLPLIPDYDDPADAFAEFTTGAPANYGRWSHADYDALVLEAGRLPDAAARLSRYRAAERILLAELPAIPLYFSVQNYLVSPRLRGWRSDRLWTRYYLGPSLE